MTRTEMLQLAKRVEMERNANLDLAVARALDPNVPDDAIRWREDDRAVYWVSRKTMKKGAAPKVTRDAWQAAWALVPAGEAINLSVVVDAGPVYSVAVKLGEHSAVVVSQHESGVNRAIVAAVLRRRAPDPAEATG